MRILRGCVELLAVPVLLCSGAIASDNADADFFERKIRPLLAANCLSCHGEKKQKGGLRLDTKAGWEKGGESGPALIAKKSKDSLLIKQVQGTPGTPPQMPPDGVLAKEQIADLITWIDSGAYDPRVSEATVAIKTIDWNQAREYWAFKPVTEPQIPKVSGAAQPIDAFVAAKLAEAKLTPLGSADRRTLIRRATFDLTGLPPTIEQVREFENDKSPDAFAKVIDRLLASPQYGEHQARAWLDLARYGEDQADSEKENRLTNAWRYRDWVVEAFNKDVPYDRFVKLQLAADLMETASDDPTDRRALGFLGLGALYSRPNDLDLARADQWDDRIDTITRACLGLTVSCARCHDHKYDPIPTQDYYSLAGIIASTKNTLIPIAPKEQVAAYEAAKAKLAEAEQKAKEVLQVEADRIALEKCDQLTEYALACWTYAAEKLEQPALKMDEYAKSKNLDPTAFRVLEKFLKNGGGRGPKLQKWYDKLPVKGGPREPGADIREMAEELPVSAKQNLAKPFKQRNMDMQNDLWGEKGAFPLVEKTLLVCGSAEWKEKYAPFQEAVKAATAAVPPEPPQCHGAAEAEKPADLKVYVRGNPSKHGELAPRRFLRALAGPDAAKFTRGSGRLDLAEAIASPTNPITARVMANRIWAQHFGRGIVATPSNFGANGERPTHPELLDYLATQFVKNGWSVKKLHREIMLSDAYQRSSDPNAKNEAVDGDNRWLWRVNRRRLTVESFRDSLLLVGGNLDLTPGGPSGEIDEQKFTRRTIYGRVSRHDLNKLMRLFDFPAPTISSDRRVDTTLPQQALFLMNSPFMAAQAKALADRFAKESDPNNQIRTAYSLSLMRLPSDSESALALKYLSAQDAPLPEDPKQKKPAGPMPTRAERFAQALLASNEFFYVD